LRMPKGTLATITSGYGSNAMDFDREMYRGSDLYKAYNTRQIFKSGQELIRGDFVDMRAPYTLISAWHIAGRYIIKEADVTSKSIKEIIEIIANILSWQVFRPWTLIVLFPFYPQEVLRAFGMQPCERNEHK